MAQSTMSERIPTRTMAEEQLNAAFKAADKRAAVWAIPTLVIAKFSEDHAVNFYTNKLRREREQVSNAYQQLRIVERSEEYPNVKQYVGMIQKISDYIPQQQKQMAYYPYAGIDIFWAAGFDYLVMEDKFYNASVQNAGMWFDVDDYNTTHLYDSVREYKTQNIIPESAEITFSDGDSEKGHVGKLFNNPDVTLIYKAGMPFISYSKKQYRDTELKYGAIVVANDCCSSTKEINMFLNDNGYTQIYEMNPPTITLPWALPIKNVGVFRKNERRKSGEFDHV